MESDGILSNDVTRHSFTTDNPEKFIQDEYPELYREWIKEYCHMYKTVGDWLKAHHFGVFSEWLDTW